MTLEYLSVLIFFTCKTVNMDTDSLAIDNYIFLNDNILLINSSLIPYKLRSSVSMNVECNYFSFGLDNIEGIKGALR